MLMNWPKVVRTGILLVLGLLPAFAGNQYLVRTQGSSINTIASRYGLTVASVFTGSASGLSVVQNPGQATEAQVLQWLNSDPGVINAEVDAHVTIPEASLASQLRQTQFSQTSVFSLLQQILWNLWVSRASPLQVTPWSGYTTQIAGILVNLGQAQKLATGSGTVAILDTGADFTHPALAGSLVPGWDFTNNTSGGYAVPSLAQSTTSILDQSTTSILDQSTTSILDTNSVIVLDQSTTATLNQSTTSILDQSTTSILDQSTTSILDSQPVDDYGHGTMVAGIIHLVAPGAKLMPVRTFTNDGCGSLSAIVAGIYYAIDHGAKVINMSFSMPSGSQELKTAVDAAYAQGIILVASAGNEGKNMAVYPASYPNVIGVGSTSDLDLRSTFSNYGAVVTLAAPGEGVITTYPQNRYAAGWGTSFSAPLVAGGAALLVQLRPSWNEDNAVRALQQATPVGQQLGAGVLDLFRACSYGASH